MHKNLNLNIPLIYLYSILIKRVSMPIIIIYFLFNNLNYTQIGILGSVMAIITVATEVHGGVFADIYGKKLSLFLSALFAFFTMFFYFIGSSFLMFLIASVCYGISGAFISGTRSALLYDTLLELKRKTEFKKVYGRMVLYSHVVNAAVLLFVPLLYTFNVKAPFLLGMVFFVFAIVVVTFMYEPQNNTKKLKNKNKTVFSLIHIQDSAKEILKKKETISIILLSVISATIILLVSSYIQPLLTIAALDVIYFGIVYASMRVIMGIGAELTHRTEKIISFKGLVMLVFILILISLITLWQTVGYVIIAGILLIKLVEGFARTSFEDELHKEITSNSRTTILSISSLVQSLSVAVIAIPLGYLADTMGVQRMLIVPIIIFAGTFAAVYYWRFKY